MNRNSATAWRQAALWGGASAIVLALHAGAAVWLLGRMDAAGLPVPIFVELAPADQVIPAADDAAQVAVPVPDEPPPPTPAAAPVAEAEAAPPALAEAEPEGEAKPEAAPEAETEAETEAEPQTAPEPARPEAEPDAAPGRAGSAPDAVALARSARPARRPVPPQRAAPRDDPAGEPRVASPQAAPSQQDRPGGQGRTAPQGSSPAAEAGLIARWKAGLAACLGRSISSVSGGRGARIVLNLTVARSGRVQGATLVSSTGNARVDREVQRGAARARGCPPAPPGLDRAAYTIQAPFTIR